MLRVGVIGCGHWGPNHIRVFAQLKETQAVACVDLDEARLKDVKVSFPDIQTYTDYQVLLQDNCIDAVCIASPTNTHFTLAKDALLAGKHVLVEKPLALLPEECIQLGQIAHEQQRVLMVGHIFLFNAGIQWLKNCVKSGQLGQIQYAYANRTNLGPFRYDVNALWDLAPHDISIFNYLFENIPLNVSARAQQCLGNSLHDLAFASLEYPQNTLVNLHVSWLDPKKVRQITLVGDKGMVVWDDLDNLGPIKLYDKHVEKTSTFYRTYGEFHLLSKEGSITIPNIKVAEPLKAQAGYFVDCIQNNVAPGLVDANKGADVVKVLKAMDASIEQKGAAVFL